MKKIDSWLDTYTKEAKEPLFVVTGALTLIYFTLIMVRSFAMDVAYIPAAGMIVYLTLLTAYVTIKEADKIKNGDNTKKKRGELFFVTWCALAGLLWLLGGLHQGNAAVVLGENLHTILTVIGLYAGAKGRELVASILSDRKKRKEKEN